jgi:hypothetical protein
VFLISFGVGNLICCVIFSGSFGALFIPVFHETWYVNYNICIRFNGALHKYVRSIIIPTLQPFKFLRQNIIAWTPVKIFMKLGMYITSSDAISTIYLINQSHR